MLITTILSQIRRMTGTTSVQYTEANFLEDINIVKDEFWSAIVSRLDEDNNYEIWATTSVSLRSEYSIPEVAYNIAGAKILKSVAINYDGETYVETGLIKYRQAKEVNPSSLPYEWNYYVENQDKDYPIFYISDNSYFIAPAPRSDEVGVNRIKLTGIRKIPDYTINTTEAQIKIPVDYQRVLVWGCIPYALMSKRADNNEVAKAQNDYVNEKTLALQAMSQRIEGPIIMSYPQENNIYVGNTGVSPYQVDELNYN